MGLFKDHSLRKKMLLYAALVSCISLLIACTAFVIYDYFSLRESHLNKIMAQADIIADTASSSLVFFDDDYATDVLSSLKAQDDISGACIFSLNGSVFAEFSGEGKDFSCPEMPASPSFSFSGGHLDACRFIEFESETVGMVFIRSELTEMTLRFKRYIMIAVGVILISLIIAVLLSFSLQAMITKPVLELVDTANHVSSEKDYSVRARQFGDDEHGLLTRAFNEMLEKIQDSNSQLLEREAMLRAVLDAIKETVVLVSAESRILTINNEGARRAGADMRQLVGENVFKLFPEEYKEEVSYNFKKIISSGEPSTFTHEKGDETYENIMYPIHDADSSVTMIALYSRDITHMKKQEMLRQQLQQAQKMEAVGHLAGGIAHDFNNMLAVIVLSTELALNKFHKDRDPSKDINQAMNAAMRAKELTMKLLTFSRQKTMEFKNISIDKIFDDLLDLLERTTDRRISIEPRIEKDIHVKVDENQIFQSLLNICNNAKDAMPSGGTLSITCRKVFLEAARVENMKNSMDISEPLEEGDYALIEIRDTGIGMTEDLVTKVFDPFFTTKGIGKGTGLGLSTTHGIVVHHKGYIEAESSPGRGSIFRIYLPVVPHCCDTCEDSTEGVMDSDSSKGVIMIVDDEESILEVVDEALTDRGYSVLCSDSPGHALNLFEKHKFEISIVILDVIMPEMDGVDLCRILQKQNSNLKVIFASGYSEDAKVTDYLDSNNNAFILKPFKMTELFEKIAQLID